MLKVLGVHFVLLGHSERRQLFAEDSALVCRKLKRALDEGLEPIVCVGELLEERKEGRTFEVLREQLMESLGDLSAAQMSRLILAYEPVWAIGTGETASPEQAQEVHAFLRQLVAERWGDAVAQGLVIQYGGSVKPANAATLLKQPDIDGLLVGGASLEATSFAQIVNSQAKVSESR
jgi:triosephosphate isomerase